MCIFHIGLNCNKHTLYTEYSDDSEYISRNTSVIIARVPVKKKPFPSAGRKETLAERISDVGRKLLGKENTNEGSPLVAGGNNKSLPVKIIRQGACSNLQTTPSSSPLVGQEFSPADSASPSMNSNCSPLTTMDSPVISTAMSSSAFDRLYKYFSYIM